MDILDGQDNSIVPDLNLTINILNILSIHVN